MKRLIKFRLPYLFAAAFLLLCIGISCSEDPTWQPNLTPEQEEIIPAVFIEDLVMPDAEEIFIPEDPIKIMGTGFDKYDAFLLRFLRRKTLKRRPNIFRPRSARWPRITS